jgi:hypothetical protein
MVQILSRIQQISKLLLLLYRCINKRIDSFRVKFFFNFQQKSKNYQRQFHCHYYRANTLNQVHQLVDSLLLYKLAQIVSIEPTKTKVVMKAF